MLNLLTDPIVWVVDCIILFATTRSYDTEQPMSSAA